MSTTAKVFVKLAFIVIEEEKRRVVVWLFNHP
jgi:hypothetical protein